MLRRGQLLDARDAQQIHEGEAVDFRIAWVRLVRPAVFEHAHASGICATISISGCRISKVRPSETYKRNGRNGPFWMASMSSSRRTGPPFAGFLPRPILVPLASRRQARYTGRCVEAQPAADHSRQASRNNCIKAAAKRGPSHSGEAAIRSRRPARNAARRGRSPAKRDGQFARNRSGSRAMVSVRPDVGQDGSSECRLANVSPGQVTTGTPIQSDSQVVSAAGKGKRVQRQVDPLVLGQHVAGRRTSPQMSSRSGSIPAAANSS